MSNKEKRRENKKHREPIKKKLNTKFICQCKKEFKFMNKRKHEQPQYHKNYILSLNNKRWPVSILKNKNEC